MRNRTPAMASGGTVSIASPDGEEGGPPDQVDGREGGDEQGVRRARVTPSRAGGRWARKTAAGPR